MIENKSKHGKDFSIVRVPYCFKLLFCARAIFKFNAWSVPLARRRLRAVSVGGACACDALETARRLPDFLPFCANAPRAIERIAAVRSVKQQHGGHRHIRDNPQLAAQQLGRLRHAAGVADRRSP